MALYIEDRSPSVRQPVSTNVGLATEWMTAQPATDAYLMQSMVNGDEMALTRLYDRYAQVIYTLAVRMVRQPGLAEEMVQETFFRVWRAASAYQGGADNFQAWLCRITRNLCLDQLRRQRARPTLDEPVARVDEGESVFEGMADPAVDVAETVWQHVQRTQVQQALGKLPAAQRRSLELAYFEGLSHREIADYLSQPLGTIKTNIRLGLLKLAKFVSSEV